MSGFVRVQSNFIIKKLIRNCFKKSGKKMLSNSFFFYPSKILCILS